ncbi:MAG: S-layer homology domain-containing protein, partial [Oscillospiraceae bacterium]
MPRKNMKKKLLSALLALTLVVSLTVPAVAAQFSDVTGTWSADFVADLFFRKVVHGYPDGLYHPSDDVTRGAISKMLLLSMKSAGSGIQEGVKNSPFKDTKSHWSEQYIVPLAEQGIIVASEYPNGFKPDTPMSRVETIKTIVRAYLYAHPEEKLTTDGKLVFTDADKIKKEDLPYVQKGVELKIIDGYEDGSFRPDTNIQRSTAAAMMSRFIKAVGKISDKVVPPSDNRVDGKVDTNKPAPTIQNVEWVLKPTVKLMNDEKFVNFSKFAPDGTSSFWDNEKQMNPTFIDLK